ncbi:MAG: response regulator [Bacteroidota bacterium]
MSVTNIRPWRTWPPAIMVLLAAIVAAGLSAGLEYQQFRHDLAAERLYQAREVQEGLSSLHRDLQMVSHLSAGADGSPGEEARDYVDARRDQLSSVRWLGVLADPSERPRILLASAEMRGYDPRRDAALAPLVQAAGEGTLTGAVPGSHREQASLAVVVGPTESGRPRVVALIDGSEFLDDSMSALSHAIAPLDLMLGDHPVGHWPRIPIHDGGSAVAEETQGITVATLDLSLSFAYANPWVVLWRIAPQPLVFLLGGLALALLVRGHRPAASPQAAPQPPGAIAALAADVHRLRLWQLGDLAGTLSHDLGQPLNVIRLSAESTQDAIAHGRLDGERVTRALNNTATQAMRAQSMIDAMVAASRRPSTPPVHLRPVEVVRHVLADLLPKIKAQGVHLDWHADLSTPPVLGHAPRLAAAVRHLTVNALEALASRMLDHGPGTLSVECRPDGRGGVAIVIGDDGPGFPPALLPLLSDPLAPVPERGKGCGLGLSIALGVAAEMGGTLSVADQTPGPGARVTLTLPPARRSLLLVEDDVAAARELADYLSARSWDVAHAVGGNPALALFQHDGADAVVTDLHMTDGDGWQLIERLRAMAPDLPIIAMSTADGDDARRAVSAGAALVLRKPVGLNELSEELEGLLLDAW